MKKALLMIFASIALISCGGGNKSSEPQVTGPADSAFVAPAEPVQDSVVVDTSKVVADTAAKN